MQIHLGPQPYPANQASPKAVSNGITEAKSDEDVWTRTEALEFVAGGARYSFDKLFAKVMEFKDGLRDAPSVKLDKPLVLIHGYNGKSTQFAPLVDQLTRDDRNGAPIYIKSGELFSDSSCSRPTEANEASRVFYMSHDKEASPEIIADELSLATAQIEKATHISEPDVIAHSLGGLGARIFCDRGGKVGKLAMIGTPNQGSRAALLSKAALAQGVGWAVTLAGASAAAQAAFSWMVPVVNGNEKLEQLNNRWPAQRRNMSDAIILGAKDFVSPNPVSSWGPGDGLIEEDSLRVGDIEVKTLSGKGRKNHSTLVSDPDINRELVDYFGWQRVANPLTSP